MKTLILFLLFVGVLNAQEEIKVDTMYHLFDKDLKYIDHSKSKDSLKQRNILSPGIYYLEKFYGPENNKRTTRCKLRINDKADTKSLKWSLKS